MPYVWSHWGEDGVDGDGVEYVYRRAVADEVDEANNSITLKASVVRPSNDWAYDSAVAPWSDDPSGVSSEYPNGGLRSSHLRRLHLRKAALVNSVLN